MKNEQYTVEMIDSYLPGYKHALLWRVSPLPPKLIHIELTDFEALGVLLMREQIQLETRMKSVIAMKIRGKWQQAELTIEVARGILKHDTAFEEIMFIENGELKKLVKPEPVESSESLPETTEAQPNTPQ